MFWCPGCNCAHHVRVGSGNGWSYNGNPDSPTFSPSILVRAPMSIPPVTPENMDDYNKNPWPQTRIETICHSFITNGNIQFLSDCTHALANQTVPLPAFDPDLENN